MLDIAVATAAVLPAGTREYECDISIGAAPPPEVDADDRGGRVLALTLALALALTLGFTFDELVLLLLLELLLVTVAVSIAELLLAFEKAVAIGGIDTALPPPPLPLLLPLMAAAFGAIDIAIAAGTTVVTAATGGRCGCCWRYGNW